MGCGGGVKFFWPLKEDLPENVWEPLLYDILHTSICFTPVMWKNMQLPLIVVTQWGVGGGHGWVWRLKNDLHTLTRPWLMQWWFFGFPPRESHWTKPAMCNEHNIKFGEGEAGGGERLSRNIKKIEFHISSFTKGNQFDIICSWQELVKVWPREDKNLEKVRT